MTLASFCGSQPFVAAFLQLVVFFIGVGVSLRYSVACAWKTFLLVKDSDFLSDDRLIGRHRIDGTCMASG